MVQEWTLPERNDERLEFPTNFAKFQNVQTLVLFFPSNHGADETKLLFLGTSCGPLSGTRHQYRSLQPVNCHIVPPPKFILMVPLADYISCMPCRAGFRGTATNNKRAVVEAVYESRAMLADHKVPGAFAAHQNLGM